MANLYVRSVISAVVLGMSPLQAFATLTPMLPRGEQLIQINEPGQTTQICVIPKRLNRAMYSEKDLKKELELCSLTRGVNAAVCPKTNSTNPGLEFFSVPAGMSSADVEARSCFIQKPTATASSNLLDKEAKYKYSTSCSYTPSILGYYHVSRILGGAGDVPPAVLRTFDLAEHKRIGKIALSKTKPDKTIHQTWKSYLSFIEALPEGRKKDQLFTDNLDESYGALSQNPSGEATYVPEFYNGGANQPARYTNFKAKNPIYKALTSSTSAQSMIGREFNAVNAQKMEQLKDMADMIVLDTMMNQEDRLGNTHYLMKYAFLDNSDRNTRGQPRLKFEKASGARAEQLKAMGAVEIKKILMKDNDCGVSRTNHSRAFSLIEGVAHISPLTYQRLLMLNQQIDQPAVKELFVKGMVFTSSDFASVRANIAHAAKVLKSNCVSGKLKLDLDAEAHFSGQTPTQNCELN